MPQYLTPLQIFENYKKANPQKCKGKSAVEICRLAGLNAKQIAELKTTSAWLFCYDKENTDTNEYVNFTEIMGGIFNSKRPKTQFNRKIEYTFQSKKQGDCWLLSDINSMNQTEWGRKAIYDAIIPDSDGSGGVTIKFKGSPLKQKDFHITADKIEKAKKSGHYSSGDDDMIAFELAVETIARTLVKNRKAHRIDNFDSELDYTSYLTGIIMRNGEELRISELITGVKSVDMNAMDGDNKAIYKMLSDKNRYAVQCSFVPHFLIGLDKELPVHSGHFYAIKSMKYGKSVELIDPYHTDEVINLSWKDFYKCLWTVNIASVDKNAREQIVKLLPDNYEENIRKESLKQLKERKLYYVNEYMQDYEASKDPRDLYKAILRIKPDNVIEVLDKYPNLIDMCDKAYHGIGKGSKKKELIHRIISCLKIQASKYIYDKKLITEFYEKCNKELNAFIYTDEKIITEEVNKIKNLYKKERQKALTEQ